MEMGADDIARFLDQVIERLDQGAREALVETQEEAMQLARDYSSGPYSAKDQRRMDAPYARRHGAASLDPSVINAQTGRFLGSWEAGPVRSEGDGISLSIVNNSPEAEFLGGTKTMFDRPIGERIEHEVGPNLTRRLNERAERALNS